MNKIILCILIICHLQAGAQPVLTRADTMRIGNIFNNTWCNHFVLFSIINDTGRNKIWDFSNIMTTSDFTIDSTLPVTPETSSPLFPSANMMDHLVTQAPGYISNNLVYYHQTHDSTFLLGSDDGTNYVKYFTPVPIGFYQPFTYGSTKIDSSFYSYSVSGIRDSVVRRDTTIGVGYGILKLPNNLTYNNVLQVKRLTTRTGTLGVSRDITIFFYQQGLLYPVFTEALNETGNYVNNVQYLSSYYRRFSFNGNGNWSDPSNWQGGVPPSVVTPGMIVRINTAPGGQCVLDMPVTFLAGASLIIEPNANFIVNGNLTIR